MQSHIEENQKAGSKFLTVFYDSHLDNFNEAIDNALFKHGLKSGEATVIALPKTINFTSTK